MFVCLLCFTAMSKTHLFDCNMAGHGILMGKETGKIISVGTSIMASVMGVPQDQETCQKVSTTLGLTA